MLPDVLKVNTQLAPEVRKRGIYSTIVYTSDDSIQASYGNLGSLIPENFAFRDKLEWPKAVISYGITDMKGVQKSIEATLNGKPLTFQPGLVTADVISSGVSREVALTPNAPVALSIQISLK